MKDNLIKTIQKFINTPFKYVDLLAFLDKQQDFLLQDNVLYKTEPCEYNALWSTICDLERFFLFANSPNLIIASKVSVLYIFDYNYKKQIAKASTK